MVFQSDFASRHARLARALGNLECTPSTLKIAPSIFISMASFCFELRYLTEPVPLDVVLVALDLARKAGGHFS
jgi:hypothetical protein